jgi:hypothetical protein
LFGRRTTALTWALERKGWTFGRVFRFWDPNYYRTYADGAGNPRMRARKSITLLVSVNSDLPDRVHSLPTSYPVGSCDPEP